MYPKSEFMNWPDSFNADNDAIGFGSTDILLFDLSYSLNARGPLQLYFLFLEYIEQILNRYFLNAKICIN